MGAFLPCVTAVPFDDGRPMNEVNRPVFARDTVQHVGDTVAAVIAETLPQAMEAAEAVEVEYEELPSVVDIARAVSPDAPVIHESLDTNIIHQVATGDPEATAAAFEGAAHVTELEMRNHRITGNPMEPRACIGQYDQRRDHYTLRATTQFPHAPGPLDSRGHLAGADAQSTGDRSRCWWRVWPPRRFITWSTR